MATESEITRRAADLVSAAQLGVLMTCDERGYPHGRWMHLLPVNGLRRLYALTARGTRKTEHIARRPQVAWIVTGDRDETVLLKGRASVNPNPQEISDVWDRLGPSMQHYAVGPLSNEDHLALVTIETVVEEIELISPPLGVNVARTVHVHS